MLSSNNELAAIQANIGRVIKGKAAAVELLLVALLAEGHVLIEDVPGVGKTTLAKALAASLNLTFRRVQFTPDLMPSDITGFQVYNAATGEFRFQPGPVFTHILLADELNRTAPRTQAALLECMEERQVTADSQTITLPRPFFVLATQNPIDLEGTYPLPEAQLDRFLLKIALGYPDEAAELAVLSSDHTEPAQLEPVMGSAAVLQLQDESRAVFVHPDLDRYILAIVRATREHPALSLGASPRAALALRRAAQALARLRGRTFVLPDDIQYLCQFVLAHRLLLANSAVLKGATATAVLATILASLPVPALEGRPHAAPAD